MTKYLPAIIFVGVVVAIVFFDLPRSPAFLRPLPTPTPSPFLDEDIKFGLTEKERKDIFNEFVDAEARAGKEAQDKFPFAIYQGIEVGFKYRDLLYDLNRKYDREIREKHNLTEEEQEAIWTESVKGNWPIIYPEY